MEVLGAEAKATEQSVKLQPGLNPVSQGMGAGWNLDHHLPAGFQTLNHGFDRRTDRFPVGKMLHGDQRKPEVVICFTDEVPDKGQIEVRDPSLFGPFGECRLHRRRDVNAGDPLKLLGEGEAQPAGAGAPIDGFFTANSGHEAERLHHPKTSSFVELILVPLPTSVFALGPRLDRPVSVLFAEGLPNLCVDVLVQVLTLLSWSTLLRTFVVTDDLARSHSLLASTTEEEDARR